MIITPSTEHLSPCNTMATRLVENQQRSATLELVGFNTEKHDLLEQILEDSKPPLESDVDERHFLIKTPFRYPPLAYGSRFGRTHEQGVFYASLSMSCLFSEVAYYRFVFLDDMEIPFTDGVTTEHTVFDVRVKTDKALLLDEDPFYKLNDDLTDPVNYNACQSLGSLARKIDTDVIRYYSARSNEQGRNLAVFEHAAIKGNPRNLKAVRCTVAADQCIFVDMHSNETYQYSIEAFLIAGVLPRPSS